MTSAASTFLLLEVAGEFSDQVHALSRWLTLIGRAGGVVVASALPARVSCLEPGTVASALVLARFVDKSSAKRAAENLQQQLRQDLPATTVPLVLLVDALPDNGLPDLLDIPTTASVPAPSNVHRHTILVVRGTAWDQSRLDRYRDVILPMHKERGGFYEAFAVQAHQIEVMSGTWTEKIFAVSRWPSRADAEDFWFCDRYQQQAIPLRLGAGRFTVHAMDAQAE